MIFGLYDFLQYRLNKGCYSDGALANEGWKLATEETYAGVNEPKRGCYFVLHRRRSFVSWAIMYVTQSRANHVGIFVGNGQVAEALTKGVTRRPLSDYFDGRSFFKVNFKEVLSEEERDGIVFYAESLVGRPYSYIKAANLGLLALFASDGGGLSHFRLYSDAVIFLLVLAIPSLWFSWWPLFSLWLLAGYLLILCRNPYRAFRFNRFLRKQIRKSNRP